MLDLVNIFSQAQEDEDKVVIIDTALITYFENIEDFSISDTLTDSILKFLIDISSSCPDLSNAITYGEFKILEKLLFIAFPSEACDEIDREIIQDPVYDFVNDANFSKKVTNRLVRSMFFQKFCSVLVRYQEKPPLALSVMLIFFLEKIFTVIWSIEEEGGIFSFLKNFQMLCFDNIEHHYEKEILLAFENCFDLVTRSSLLAVAMIDQVYSLIILNGIDYDDFINNISDHAECFNRLLHRWNFIGFENVTFIEQIYGLAFIKWFLICLSSNPYLDNVILSDALIDSIGSHHGNKLFYTCCMFFLKSLQCPYNELQMICGPDGNLRRKYPWIKNFPWESNDKLITLLKLDKDDCDERIVNAWYELYHTTAPSETLMLTIVSEISKFDLWKQLRKIAFLRNCRSADPPQIDFSRLLVTIKDDNPEFAIERRFTEVVYKRYNLINSTLPDVKFGLDEVCLIAIVTSFPDNCSNIFGRYITDGMSVTNSYVIASNSHELNTIYRVIGDVNYNFFKCPCGFTYVIDNCKQPMENRPCPQCGKVIGGANHAFLGDHERVNPNANEPLGYYFQPDFLEKVEHSERLLTPNEYRILALLVNSCILHGLYMRPNAFQTVFGHDFSIQTSINHCWRHMKIHWNVLKQRLTNNGNVERLCSLILELSERVKSVDLGPLPTTPDGRQHVENILSNICRPIIDNYDEESFQAIHKFVANIDINMHEKEMKELDQPSTFVARYLRVTVTPSYERFHMAFGDIDSSRYPIINSFFQFEEQLSR